MARAGSARREANARAAARGWVGARGGSAGAARAERAYERKYGERAAFRASVLFSEGAGSSANNAQRAWNRERRSDQYKAFRARAQELSGGSIASAKRKSGAWNSDFNELYRQAAADNFSMRKGGAYQKLLSAVGWSEAGKEAWLKNLSPKVKARMTSTPAGGVFS